MPDPQPAPDSDKRLIEFRDSDIVIGLVGPVGTEWDDVTSFLKDRFQTAGYPWDEVRVSRDVIGTMSTINSSGEADRITQNMDAGNAARKKDSGILADGVAAVIAKKRDLKGQNVRRAFVVNSLKHPEEVVRLRRIYAGGFYLIGV